MMRDAGAREVHMRIASPPTKHSCFYGVDTPERAKLLAAQMNVEAMRDFINADSLPSSRSTASTGRSGDTRDGAKPAAVRRLLHRRLSDDFDRRYRQGWRLASLVASR
jgi:amidophosphoribosyltransferase